LGWEGETMKKATREEILSNAEYGMEREEIRGEVMRIKAERRIHVGQHLTFLFENRATVRYQVQEMMRIEGLSDEADIQHELKTYNELLGDERELGCTLMIEIDDALQRDIVLRKWLDLPRHIYLKLENGELARAIFDERQVGEDRLSSVQYLKFACPDGDPVAIGLDHPTLEICVELEEEQRAALAADLR